MADLKHIDFEIPGWAELAQGPKGWPSYRDLVVSLNPLAYWRLDETSGDTAHDVMDVQNGTYRGAPDLDQSGLLTRDSNASARFDGQDDVIDWSRLDPSGVSVTMALWLHPLSFSDRNELIFWGGDYPNYILSILDGKAWFFLWDGSQVHGVQNGTAPPLNQTSFLAGVYDAAAGAFRYYLDGTLDSTVTDAVAPNVIGTKNRIGGNPGVDGRFFFHGRLDEPAVWNRALSDDELKSLAARGRARLKLGV